MIFYNYVRKNLLIAALLQDIFGRISQVIAVLSLGQQSLVRMKLCTLWDSWHPMQTFQTAKKIKCSSPVKTSQYPNNIGQQLHSMLRIQFLQGLEAILVSIRIPADIGYLGVISSKTISTSHGQVIIASRPHLWSRLLKQGTSMASLSKFTPAFFTRCCAWQKKMSWWNGERGEPFTIHLGPFQKKKTQRFRINWSTYLIILDCPDSTSPRHKLHTNALATASLFEGTAIGHLQASIWQWFG